MGPGVVTPGPFRVPNSRIAMAYAIDYGLGWTGSRTHRPKGNAMAHTEVTAHVTTPTGPVVWLLMAGEDYEGGHILGVFATKDLAKGPFYDAASDIPFDLDEAWQDGDGAVRVHGGCDWVSLKPYPLVTAPQVTV